MNKTALQQLIEWGDQMLKDNPGKVLSFHEAIDKAEELLSVEKEQIMDAYFNGVPFGSFRAKQCEQYYNETYGGDQ